MNIGGVGCGYVGLVTAACLAELGHNVVAAENDAAKLILTEWPEFAALDLKRVRNLLRSPIVLDGRNLYSPSQMKAAGLDYMSVGRPAVLGGSSSTEPVVPSSSVDDDSWTKRAVLTRRSYVTTGHLRKLNRGARITERSSIWRISC